MSDPNRSSPNSSALNSFNDTLPEKPYQTGKGCLILAVVFGGIIVLAVAIILITGAFSDKA